jgi:cytochrome c
MRLWWRAALLIGGLLGLGGCDALRETPPLRQVPGGDPELGPSAMRKYGCGACHVVPGVQGAEGRAASPLTHFGDRAFVAGVLSNTPENLVRWVRFPTRINPHTAMPDLGVNEHDARDMAAYLYTLRAPQRSVPR